MHIVITGATGNERSRRDGDAEHLGDGDAEHLGVLVDLHDQGVGSSGRGFVVESAGDLRLRGRAGGGRGRDQADRRWKTRELIGASDLARFAD